MVENLVTGDVVISAERASQLTRANIHPLINKYLEEINRLINKAASQGENKIEFKFPEGTVVSVIRQVQVALTSRGYVVNTSLVDLYQDGGEPLDVISNLFGIFNLAKMSMYAQYESATLTISW